MTLKGERVEEEEHNVAEVTDLIGGFGRWQAYLIGVLALSKMVGCYHNFATTFSAPKVDHWCSLPADLVNVTSPDLWKANATVGHCERRGFNPSDHQWNGSSSTLLDWIDFNRTQPCQHWVYDRTVFGYTLTEKFSMVCDRSWLISLNRSIYMAGFLLACLVMGPLADRFGRRPVMLTCSLVFLVSALVNAFSPNYIVFVVSRFLLAFGRVGVLNATFVLSMEVVGTRYRPSYAVFHGISFVLGYITLPGVAYLTRTSWFYFQLAIAAPTIPLALVFWTIPESPRWLILKGKTDEAKKTIVGIAKINRIPIRDPDGAIRSLTETLKKNTGNREGTSIVALLRTPNMRKKTLVLFFTWCVVSFVFYGLSFNVGDIGGDLFSSFALFGAAQLPAYLLSLLTLGYLGRRLTLSGALALAGIACLAILPLKGGSGWFRVTLATIGMSFISAAFNVAYLYSSEIFPTSVRSLGVTSCSVCARVGSIVAPFMKELGEGNDFMVPMGLFGGLSLSAGLLVFFLLPDTTGCSLPETLEQGELFGRKMTKSPPGEPRQEMT